MSLWHHPAGLCKHHCELPCLSRFACVLQPGPAPVAEMATVPMQLAALHKAAQRGDEQEVAALLDQVMHKPGPSWACRAQHLQQHEQQDLAHTLRGSSGQARGRPHLGF